MRNELKTIESNAALVRPQVENAGVKLRCEFFPRAVVQTAHRFADRQVLRGRD
jgi:hypothetical protein